jgi:hypothetical protein
MQKKPSICALFFLLANIVCSAAAAAEEEHVVDPRSGEFWGQIVAIFFLVVLSGIVAGKYLLIGTPDVYEIIFFSLTTHCLQ